MTRTKLTPEEADRRLTVILRGRAAEWVRRYTIEECALVAERAMAYKDVEGRTLTKAELLANARDVVRAIRALSTPKLT